MNVLNVSGSFQVTKDAIIKKAQEKLKIERRVEEAERGNIGQEDAGNDETQNGDAIASPKVSPYMVKVNNKECIILKSFLVHLVSSCWIFVILVGFMVID